MKCYWCQKELQEISYEMVVDSHAPESQELECPDIHCSLTFHPEKNQIANYTFFVDHKGKRYKIVGNREKNTTHFLVKAGRYTYSTVLLVKRYLAFKPNKDGVLEANAVFKKLQTLVLFS